MAVILDIHSVKLNLSLTPSHEFNMAKLVGQLRPLS